MILLLILCGFEINTDFNEIKNIFSLKAISKKCASNNA